MYYVRMWIYIVYVVVLILFVYMSCWCVLFSWYASKYVFNLVFNLNWSSKKWLEMNPFSHLWQNLSIIFFVILCVFLLNLHKEINWLTNWIENNFNIENIQIFMFFFFDGLFIGEFLAFLSIASHLPSSLMSI